MRTPQFWYPASAGSTGPLPWLLAPLALCYLIAGWLRRCFARPYRAPVPVICVGNLTAGGAGKTPVALALAAKIQVTGIRVHFLTRGFGGSLAGPVRVDQNLHTAKQVGDEALLLARLSPCWVARNRKQGAQAAMAAGAELLILDDGHQNPQLHKDLSLVLVDAARGFGNGWVIPSGPLRETVAAGIARADAVLYIGEGGDFPDSGKPQLRAMRRLRAPQAVHGERLFAFCGIGAPQQFFDMLQKAGAHLAGTRAFPDHHPFTDDDVRQIISVAEKSNAVPVTTEKDWVRLPAAFSKRITAIGMDIQFSDEAALMRLVEPVLRRRV